MDEETKKYLEIMIENKWDKFGDERLKGITVYQVARKMGAAKKLVN